MESTSRTHIANSTMLGLTFTNASGGQGNCVDVARDADGYVWMRNSNNVHGPAIRYTDSEWQAFREGVRNGVFDQI